MEQKFHLKVASREGIIYEGEVASITTYNEKGMFDVLFSHANFISLIKKGITLRESEKSQERSLNFENALLRVRENKVEVYLGVEGVKSGS